MWHVLGVPTKHYSDLFSIFPFLQIQQHQIHSLAEHEAEMQRQMMSVPVPGTQIINPPGNAVANLGPPPHIGTHILKQDTLKSIEFQFA